MAPDTTYDTTSFSISVCNDDHPITDSPTKSATLLSLPNELLVKIATQAEFTSDLHGLCQTSSRLWHIVKEEESRRLEVWHDGSLGPTVEQI